MPGFRHCCHYQRTSSPDLPNAQPVSCPTQDEGYDADAVLIDSTNGILAGSLRPKSAEPRPSSDTVIYHGNPLQSQSTYVKSLGEGSLKPDALRSPRSRSHSRPSQPLSDAAMDNYLKISPSRAALRKRLQAVEGQVDPLLLRRSARVASMPDSIGVPQWQAIRVEDTARFRRPIFWATSLNINEEEDIKEQAPQADGSRAVSAPIPRSNRSDSMSVSSLHLYNMQISHRLASSQSTTHSPEDLSDRTRHASTTERASEVSGLRSPKESSSVYSSCGDDLALSRRNSLLVIQGIPARIARLKNRATSGDLHGTSASQLTVITRSRFGSSTSDELKQQAQEDIGSIANGSNNKALRRSSTEPSLSKLNRGALASFDGSGEWHLSPPSRGYGGDHAPSIGAISVWERALREHSEEDKMLSRIRTQSISQEIGRDDFRRRARSRRLTRTPSPLGEIVEDPWSHECRQEREPVSGRVSPTQPPSGRVSPTQGIAQSQQVGRQSFNISRTASTSTRSVQSWTRFPSHTFAERTEAASAKDNVIARDFAPSISPQRRLSKKKSRSMTFSKSVLNKIGRMYKTRSSDFRRYNAGHRSSISVGRVPEYPELEIPRPSFSPTLLSDLGDRRIDSTASPPLCLPKVESSAAKSNSPPGSPEPTIRLNDCVDYADCVNHPRNTDEETVPDGITAGGGPQSSSIEFEEAIRLEIDKAKDEALEAAERVYRKSMEIERLPKLIQTSIQ